MKVQESAHVGFGGFVGLMAGMVGGIEYIQWLTGNHGWILTDALTHGSVPNPWLPNPIMALVLMVPVLVSRPFAGLIQERALMPMASMHQRATRQLMDILTGASLFVLIASILLSANAIYNNPSTVGGDVRLYVTIGILLNLFVYRYVWGNLPAEPQPIPDDLRMASDISGPFMLAPNEYVLSIDAKDPDKGSQWIEGPTTAFKYSGAFWYIFREGKLLQNLPNTALVDVALATLECSAQILYADRPSNSKRFYVFATETGENLEKRLEADAYAVAQSQLAFKIRSLPEYKQLKQYIARALQVRPDTTLEGVMAQDAVVKQVQMLIAEFAADLPHHLTKHKFKIGEDLFEVKFYNFRFVNLQESAIDNLISLMKQQVDANKQAQVIGEQQKNERVNAVSNLVNSIGNWMANADELPPDTIAAVNETIRSATKAMSASDLFAPVETPQLDTGADLPSLESMLTRDFVMPDTTPAQTSQDEDSGFLPA